MATYNVLHGLALGEGRVDLPAVARTIVGLGADVVALQEVDRAQPRSGRVDQVAWLAAALGWHGVFGPALLGDPDRAWVACGPDDPGGPAYGVGLLSRHPFTGTGRHRLPGGGDGRRRAPPASPSRPGWDREPRTLLEASIDLGRRPLALATTHLSYLPWRAVRQLRAVSRRLARHPYVLLLGDLNLTARTVRRAAPGWRIADGPRTYPAWAPRFQVDHVLARGMVPSGARTGTRTTGDHLPLLADVPMS